MNFHNHETEPMPDGAAQSTEQPTVEKSVADALVAEVERLKQRLLSAAGDDLCRLSQEEIKAYTSGAVKIPPIEEFLPSCARFHAQIADEAGVLDNCLTLAQLIADNERLTQENAALRELVAELRELGDKFYAQYHIVDSAFVVGQQQQVTAMRAIINRHLGEA